MFSETLNSIQSGFSKFVTPQRLFVLVVFSVLAWFLLSYSDTKSFNVAAQIIGRVETADAKQLTIESEFGTFKY